MRSFGSVFGFSTLAKSSFMSWDEGSSLTELVVLMGVRILGELGLGLSIFDMFSNDIWQWKRRYDDGGKRVGDLREDITCGRVWAERL